VAFIPRLAMAELDHATDNPERCRKHLDTAAELCQAEDIRRFRCECVIAFTRFHLWQGHLEEACLYFVSAVREVSDMKYYRRAGQLRDIANCAGWDSPEFRQDCSSIHPSMLQAFSTNCLGYPGVRVCERLIWFRRLPAAEPERVRLIRILYGPAPSFLGVGFDSFEFSCKPKQ
jgi:hypothetical protein